MKINISIQLDNKELPIDWRRKMLSLIKLILKNKSEDLYEEFYGIGKNTIKPFTFWALFPEAKFSDRHIELSNNKFNLFISTTDLKLAFILYEGAEYLQRIGKHVKIKDIGLRIIDVDICETKKIIENEIIVNMLSPLVVKQHFREKNDKYFLYNEENFNEMFKQCVGSQLKGIDKVPEITPIKAKKVIVKAYGTNIPASLGIFKLSGDIKILNQLYQTGMSSKNGAGFGKFEIVY